MRDGKECNLLEHIGRGKLFEKIKNDGDAWQQDHCIDESSRASELIDEFDGLAIMLVQLTGEVDLFLHSSLYLNS